MKDRGKGGKERRFLTVAKTPLPIDFWPSPKSDRFYNRGRRDYCLGALSRTGPFIVDLRSCT